MTSLAPNESREIEVDPRPLFASGGIRLFPGERYDLVASGRWKDAWKTCGPTGWALWPLQCFNRLPGARFLCLCGCPGEDLTLAFAIGTGCEWTVPSKVYPGTELKFFANDWPNRYGNNHPLSASQGGPLLVTVERLE